MSLKDIFRFRVLWRPRWARPTWDFEFLRGNDLFTASLWVAFPGAGFTIFFPDWFFPGNPVGEP